MIGQKLNNRYTLISMLGEGGMGEVYLADDEQTRQQVAVKILARQLTAHPESLERFRREAKTLRQLDHPNIVKFIDAFEHERQYVIVMEYVPGGSLHSLLKKEQLQIERARQIALGLCDALIRSHQLSIIHRDIKPENVLLDEHRTPKLADFGVARLSEGTRMTRSGTQVGTPYYMSPEAWEGKTLDGQADIWSLGALLFEMLSGQIPFSGDTPLTVMNKIFTSELPDLKKLRKDVPNDLAQIVKRMLAKDKSVRYKTMRQVAVDLEGDEPMPLPQISKPVKPTRIVTPKQKIDFSRYRSFFIIGIAIIGVFVAINFLPSLRTSNQPTIQNTSTLIALPTNTKVSITNTSVPVTSTPELGIGSTIVSEIDGMTMVFVPAGEFTMGSDANSDEQPIHQVDLDAYWIDQTEVTNAMYAKCVDAGGCQEPIKTSSHTRSSYFGNPQFADYPVVYVNWNMANAYCAWAERRLPTEAEWEKAARGVDGRTYPWGEEISCTKANYRDGNNFCVGETIEVGSYETGKSIYGTYDMVGNVSEWVSSLSRSYPYDASDVRENMSIVDSRVVRGGSWNSSSNNVRSANRSQDAPTWAEDLYGFRCVLSP